MPRLLHDRYLPHDERRAWDLATGDLIELEGASESALANQPPNNALIEVLDHGRDGAPRVVRAHACRDGATALSLQRAAADGRARGFIPLSVEMYLRLASILVEELKDRTLMLIASARTPVALAREALIDAAARAPRPHVLLTFACAEAEAPPSRGFFVREAPAVYQFSPHAAATRLRVHSPDVVQLLTKAQRASDFVRTGCHAAAERLLRDVAGALLRRRAFEPAVRILISLGRILLERGRAADADESFGAAADAAQDGTVEALDLDARIWQALARTDAGRLTGAESLCRALLLTGGLTGSRKMWAEASLARVLLWQRRDEEASSFELVSPRVDDLDDVTAASSMAMAVRLLVQRERVFEAGQRARDLLVTMGASSDPIVRAIMSMAHLRVLCAAGDLMLVEQCLCELSGHARAARAPLRIVRARLLVVDALRRAGRDRDAAEQMKRLAKVRRVVPPLLRMAIDARFRAAVTQTRPTRAASPSGVGIRAVALIKIANEDERDEQALRDVLKHLADSLNTSRVDMVAAGAGPVSTLLSVGDGVLTRLGGRVLEAGIAIGPEPGDAGREIAVPVRAGQRLVAAFAARWAIDTAAPPHAAELIELAAAIAAPRAEAMLASARETAGAAIAVPELVGASSSMTDVRKAIARAAGAPFAVLIEGESGVGKELVARAIHQLGPRRERRFCDVNCAALPEELLESELFGHARGAFTGAVIDRSGLFEDANGGTVFLDEVADLSPRAQAKLLRVLQQHEVRRVGEAFSRKIDVRIVSAANREMRTEAAEGRFRHDLLYRLDVIRIRIPPLRERPEDVPLLAAHFWRAAASRVGTTATLAHSVMAALSRYHWPGNVRELQNVMSALAVAAPARGQVRAGLLPSAITGATALSSSRFSDARSQFERRFIEAALARAGGSRARAARELGLSRQGLLKVMNRLGLGERREHVRPIIRPRL